MCLPMCAGFVITNIRITTLLKTKIPSVFGSQKRKKSLSISYYVTHVSLETTYLIFLLKTC